MPYKPKNKHSRTRRKKLGLQPGELPKQDPEASAKITIVEFSSNSYSEHAVQNPGEIPATPSASGVRWIDVTGISDSAAVLTVATALGLHPLAIEDICTPGQRPRFEDYGDYVQIFMTVLLPKSEDGSMQYEQLCIVLGSFGIATFRESQYTYFDSIHKHIAAGQTRARSMGPDYMAYRLVDAVIDHYFAVIEELSESVDLIQDEIMTSPQNSDLGEIHRMRREVLFLQRTMLPLRAITASMLRSGEHLFSKPTAVFLRDLAEHAEHAIESSSAMREGIDNAIGMYMNAAGNRLNEIIRVLTVMSTVFIPLTFITGLYGMNFSNMPELHWRYGYLAVCMLMAILAAWLIWFFRRKKWL